MCARIQLTTSLRRFFFAYASGVRPVCVRARGHQLDVLSAYQDPCAAVSPSF